jgi:hypothetical protein
MTIQATPADYSSVQFDLIYTVAEPTHTSDPATYPNYKFIGDVYIGGVLVARIKKVPDPATGIGIFNVGQVVRNYIKTVFNPAANAIIAQKMGDGEFSVTVTMEFGEEYAYTMYTSLIVDSARTFYNNYNNRVRGEISSLSTFLNKVVTSRPVVTPVRDDSSFNFISYFPSTTVSVAIQIKSYNYSNSLIATYNTTFSPDSAGQLHIINASKAAINGVNPGMINDSIKYYTVKVGTDLYQFNLECEPVYQVYTLHFLNKYGGFESKDFSKVSRKTIDIEKKDFGKLPYTVDASGAVSYKSSNNVYNESRSVYSSQYKEKMVLNTDNLTDQEYAWLGELILSPMVYMEDAGYFYPVVISESSYEPKKNVNDDITNLTINIEFGEQLNAQFR